MTIKDNFTGAADAEALATIAADRAAGRDPFGDDDDHDAGSTQSEFEADGSEVLAASADDEQESAGAEAGSADPGSEQAAADDSVQAEDEPAAANAEHEPSEAEAPQYQTKPRAELQAERRALRAERSEAFQKFSTGEMSAEEYQAVETRVDDALEEITVQSALALANEQQALASQRQHVDRIKALGKSQGIDYADQANAAMFDRSLNLVASDPAIAAKGEAAIYNEAHRMVLAMQNITITIQPKTQAADKTPPPRERPKGPLTLRDMPAAASSQTSGGPAEQLSRLSGLDFQDQVAKMPREQRNAWMDS